MNLKKEIENALVRDENSLNETLCVIKAVYKLSYNHYLVVNGFSESDLQKQDGGIYRRLTSWPSQSRFIFSLEQMRDAYERLGSSEIANKIMTPEQIDESQKRKKSKESFWTILGETEDAFESFRLLANDEKIEKLRLLCYAYRLVLFQTKITEFRETNNFIVLLKSVNKELAQEAFQNCASIVPLPHDFFDQDVTVDSSDCKSIVEKLREQLKEKDRAFKELQQNYESTKMQIEATIAELQETKLSVIDLMSFVRESILKNQEFCEKVNF